MIFVIICLFDHFTLKPVPSVNGVWIITFVSHHHFWVVKFKPSFMFFKLSVLSIRFDVTQHVVKASRAGHVSVCYEVINLFIKPQNFLLVFFVYKRKGFYLIVTVCDGLLMAFLHFVCKLLPNMRKQHIAAVSPEFFCLWLLT